MTDFTFPYGSYDVEGSINYFIKQNLLATLPEWAGDIPINFDFPNQQLVFPTFSVTHMSQSEMKQNRHEGDWADGGNKGVPMQATFEVSCWVDATVDQKYTYYLRTMGDMVVKLFRQNPAIPILSLYSGIASPVASGYILRITDVHAQDAPGDLNNPAIKRRRVVVSYFYEQRF